MMKTPAPTIFSRRMSEMKLTALDGIQAISASRCQDQPQKITFQVIPVK